MFSLCIKLWMEGIRDRREVNERKIQRINIFLIEAQEYKNINMDDKYIFLIIILIFFYSYYYII